MHVAFPNVALPFVHVAFLIGLFHVSIFKTKAEDIRGRGRGLGLARVGIVCSFSSN